MDKETLRKRILELRRKEENKDEKSKKIFDRIYSLTEFRQAVNIVFYADVGSEVRTRPYILKTIEMGKKILFPYCLNNNMFLSEILSLSELSPGTFGILEPVESIREDLTRRIPIDEFNIVLVPGVAFDANGGRLGRGRGYYDRFLRKLSPNTISVALAFRCQVIDFIPTNEKDMFVDKIVTEQFVYDCRERRESGPSVA